MKNGFTLGRVRLADEGVATTISVDGRAFLLSEDLPGDVANMLADWDTAFPNLEAIAGRIRSGTFEPQPVPLNATPLSPIPRPGKAMCAAANYAAHVAEMAQSGFTGPANAPKQAPVRPARPYHFLKAPSCAVGPQDDVVLPSAEHRIDWEVELGAVIGRPAKNVSEAHALKHIAGYVVVNDVSCRAATWRDDRPNIRSDWLAGKSYDTFLPTGPHFVPAQFVPDYRALRLRLWVNGEKHQDGLATDMIFSLEEQIAYLSSMLTLEPGDLIATGTPAGVGQGKGAYLKPGDIMEAEIDGLGRQRNRVRL